MYIPSLLVKAPVLEVASTTATSISLSWTSAGTVVDSYEVMWERDTSGECDDEDTNSTSLSGSSFSYTIQDLEEDSTYTITVSASNDIGSADGSINGATMEAGKPLNICSFS